jgi:hypothetical protein
LFDYVSIRSFEAADSIYRFDWARKWYYNWSVRSGFLFDVLSRVFQQICIIKRKLILTIFTIMLYKNFVLRGVRFATFIIVDFINFKNYVV